MPERSAGRRRAQPGSTSDLKAARALKTGDRVRFVGESQARFKVRAVGDRYVVLTKPFNAQHTVLYTVIDLELGIRGASDSWGTGFESPEEIAESIAMLEAGDAAVSMRNSVSLQIGSVASD